jgi:hypothetical protein
MIINKELVVSNRKKADIIEELRQKKFRAFPKVAKVKSVGDADDAEEGANDDAEEAAATGSSTDYDYLLGMPIWSLTKEKVRQSHAFVHFFMDVVLNGWHAPVCLPLIRRSRNSSNKQQTRRRSYWPFLSSLQSRSGTRTSTASSRNGRWVHASEPNL